MKAVLFGKRPALVTVYFLLAFRHVALVRDQYLLHVGQRVLVNLLEPVLDVVERRLLCAVVDQEDAHRALVVRLCDRPEPLLAGSVPHLQLDRLLSQLDSFYPEVDANGRHVRGRKLVV